VESLRGGAGRLASDLAAVETNMGELYDAASGRADSPTPTPAAAAPAPVASPQPGSSTSERSSAQASSTPAQASSTPAQASAIQASATPEQVEDEALWLGLRMADGIDRHAHAARYGQDPLAPREREPAAQACVQAGWLQVTPDHVRLTRAGFLFADEVAVRLGGASGTD